MTTILAFALAASLIAIAWFAAIAKVRKEQKNEWENKFWILQSDYDNLQKENKNGTTR